MENKRILGTITALVGSAVGFLGFINENNLVWLGVILVAAGILIAEYEFS